MAVSKIKQSGASPPGDFTSLSSWEASKQADLTGNGPEEAECYGFVDATFVAIDGWTTTAADYIRIYGAPTADGGEGAGINDGRSRDVSGTGYQLSSADNVLDITEDFIRIEDVDIVSTGASGAFNTITFSSINSGADFLFSNLIIHDKRSSAIGNSNIFSADSNTAGTIRNCIIYGRLRGLQMLTSGINVAIEHCTVFGDADFGMLVAIVSSVNNTYSGGHSSEDFFTASPGAPSGDYNMSEDTTATIDFANGAINKAAADQFVNASLGSSADFTPKEGADIIAFAPRLAGITVDIVGASRVDPTTVGAWEFIVAAGASANPISALLGL